MAEHDTGMQREDEALARLMPGESMATHVAVASGSWFDSDVWSPAEVPGEGAIVRIPAATRVRYEGASEAHLFMVRVDGDLELSASSGQTTLMVVDTLLGTSASRLAIDAAAPQSGPVEIEIRPFDIEAHRASGARGWPAAAVEHYRDGAPVRDSASMTRKADGQVLLDDGPGVLGRWPWDHLQLSLGIVAHGAVRLAGQPKTARIALAEPGRAGERSILLSETPSGWETGDQLVVTSTRYVGRDPDSGASIGTEDEIRRIADLDGAGVTLDRPLAFDHSPPEEGLDTYVVNLSRNVRIRSSIDVPLDDLEAARVGEIASSLGHVMFMHTADVQVRHVAFDDLGRTNKNDTLDDFARRELDAPYAPRRRAQTGGDIRTPPNQLTNPRGRYSVHVHRSGATPNDPTAHVEGAVVTGGPGWGFVSHDSRADFIDCIAYGVLGAGFVAEVGNEAGTWAGNTAINTFGAAFNDPHLDPRGPRFLDDDFEEVVLMAKRGAWKSHDFGRYGNGFWLQGKLIDMRENVSISSGLWGYFFMFRAPDQKNVHPGLLAEPLSVHSPDGIHPFAPGLNVFTGNESIADRGGLVMIGLGGGRTNDERTMVEDFTAWEVGQTGTRAQYYPVYTITRSTFLASRSPGANPREGVLLDKAQVDTVLAHLRIEGFPRQYNLRKVWSPGSRNQHGFEGPYRQMAEARAAGEPNPAPLAYAHVVIDGGFRRDQARESRRLGPSFREEDLILDTDELHPGRFEVILDDDSLRCDLELKEIDYGRLPDDPIRPTLPQGHVLILRGTKRDSIGDIPIDYLNNILVWHEDAVQHRLETDGYYRMPNGSLGVELEELLSDRYTGEKHLVRFVAELDPRWDLSAAIDRGRFETAEHEGVYVPGFLLGETRDPLGETGRRD